MSTPRRQGQIRPPARRLTRALVDRIICRATMLERIGNCRIVEEIASGGMAVVYRPCRSRSAARSRSRRSRPRSLQDAQFAIALRARGASSLVAAAREHHPRLRLPSSERGALFIVMEYVQGIDLYDLLEKCGRAAARRRGDHRDAGRARARLRALPRHRPPRHQAREHHDLATRRREADGLRHRARPRASATSPRRAPASARPRTCRPEQILGDKLDFRAATSSRSASCSTRWSRGRKPFVEDEQQDR